MRARGKESPPEQSSSSARITSGGAGHRAGRADEAAAGGAAASRIRRRPSVTPHPVTFVQTDAAAFKQVVQLLTGSDETVVRQTQAILPPPPPLPVAPGLGRPDAFRLSGRRHASFHNLRIDPFAPVFLGAHAAHLSARGPRCCPRRLPDVLSPSTVEHFPAVALSPVTPLVPDPFARPPHPSSPAGRLAEERGIAEKGYYLHPSPRGAETPKLLPLFPVTSPKAAAAAAAAPHSSDGGSQRSEN